MVILNVCLVENLFCNRGSFKRDSVMKKVLWRFIIWGVALVTKNEQHTGFTFFQSSVIELPKFYLCRPQKIDWLAGPFFDMHAILKSLLAMRRMYRSCVGATDTVKSGIVVMGWKFRHSFLWTLNACGGIIFELSNFKQKQSSLQIFFMVWTYKKNMMA